jgi:hypothetical protein
VKYLRPDHTEEITQSHLIRRHPITVGYMTVHTYDRTLNRTSSVSCIGVYGPTWRVQDPKQRIIKSAVSAGMGYKHRPRGGRAFDELPWYAASGD